MTKEEELRELKELEELARLEELESQEYFSSPEPQAETIEPPSRTESAIGGLSSYLSFGFSDEIAGAVEASKAGFKGEVGSLDDLLDIYRSGRQEELKALEREERAHPGIFHGTGIAASLLTPLGAKGLGLKLGSKVMKAAAPIFGGAATGLGTSSADLTKANITETAEAMKDTALGGTLGYLAPKALSKASKTLSNYFDPKKLMGKAGREALRSVRPSKDLLQKELKNVTLGEEKGVGKALLGTFTDESGKKRPILDIFGDPQDLVDNIRTAISQLSDKLSPLYDEAQEGLNKVIPKLMPKLPKDKTGKPISFIGLQMYKASSDLQNKLLKLGKDDQAKALKKMTKSIVGRMGFPDFDMKKLAELKKMLGEELSSSKWAKTLAVSADPNLTQQNELYLKFYNIVKKDIEDKANLVSKGLGSKIKSYNMDYSNLLDARSAAFAETVMREKKAMGLIGIGDVILPGIAQAATGSPLAALMTFAGKKVIEGATKRDLGSVVNLIKTKSLYSLANKVAKYESSKAKVLSDKIKKLALIPATQRAGRLVQLLAGNEEFTGIQVQDISKPKPESKLAITSENFNKLEGEELTNLANQFNDDNRIDKLYKYDLLKAAKADKSEKNRILHKLWQDPNFRQRYTNASKAEPEAETN